jgi:hypothetical protein
VLWADLHAIPVLIVALLYVVLVLRVLGRFGAAPAGQGVLGSSRVAEAHIVPAGQCAHQHNNTVSWAEVMRRVQ